MYCNRIEPVGTIALACMGIMLSLTVLSWADQSQTERQMMVHKMGANVMPFDLSKTLHIFEMTDHGGIQQVIIRDPKDKDQLPMIRQHLQYEAMRFREGNFTDPISLHGKNMPGIKELSANASKIKIDYGDLPNGAQLTFETNDLHLITAIHRWFGAQLSDHGADATYK